MSFKTRMEDPVRHANHRFRSRVGAWICTLSLNDKNTARYDLSFSKNFSFLRGLFFMPHSVYMAPRQLQQIAK